MRYHPWRDLRERSHVVVDWRTMPPGMLGATNGEDIIWMDRRLLQVERRCVVAHEIVHVDWAHAAHQDDRTEHRVRREAAKRLLSVDQLIPVALWTQSVDEAADELWVTVEVLEDFVGALSPAEVEEIEEAVREAHE